MVGASLSAQTSATLPKDALALQTSYHEARQQALEPVERKYRAELERLLILHTKAGHIDEAMAVKTELSRLAPEFTSKLLMDRAWSYTLGPRQIEGEWKFKPDHTVGNGRWSISGNILRVVFPETWNEFSITLLNTPNGMCLVEINSSSGMQNARLTQKSK